MHILFLVSAMGSGGAERVAATLANAWTNRGNQVTLMPTFSGGGECFYELSPEVRLVYLADLVSSRVRTWVNQLDRLRALRRFIATERPDVIISFLSNVNVAAIIASVGLGVPVIVCEHNDPFAEPHPLLLRLACKLTYPFADILMVLTDGIASKYAAHGLFLPKIFVVPNPIFEQLMNVVHYSSNDAAKKRLLGIGRLEKQKHFDVLIKVFANLARRHADWSLRILGEGSLRTDLQQQIVDLGLDSRIELPGIVSAVINELVEADIFALTSRYEGFPMALLEAMAVGLPCVSFDCPSGPRELSLDGQVALLVPPNDEQALERALERLMVDADLRITLGSQARRSVIERYSLAIVLKQWDALFAEVGVIL
ncbi:MAG: glycosyltransferase family 4 protein [Methylococcales bacterium]|nr:glycosyltransferase family 4 protein [Methylococcales bacterium]